MNAYDAKNIKLLAGSKHIGCSLGFLYTGNSKNENPDD